MKKDDYEVKSTDLVDPMAPGETNVPKVARQGALHRVA